MGPGAFYKAPATQPTLQNLNARNKLCQVCLKIIPVGWGINRIVIKENMWLWG